ncbi:MAG: glycoside hydrolase family 31 protein [Turicibacter sp.]|nr:glycoside hydrolase family 31 protein [Turicibacter sp.]
MNKRGWLYTSFCTDDDMHTETKQSLYGTHNFLVCHEEELFGIFVDYPGKVHFDIGYTDSDTLTIHPEMMNINLYIIYGSSILEIIQTFRTLIGQSYMPPKWAFGYQQSRWSYETEADVLDVVKKFKINQIPLDSIYLDIDYMQNFKDFTVDSKRFPNFESFVKSLKKVGVHLVPIIDASVKVEPGYEIYEEGIKNGYFIKSEDGTLFEVAVWPGKVHFPDFLNK